MAKWTERGKVKEEVFIKPIEKSQKQVEYESALSYINSKGFDIETNIKKGASGDIAQITVLRNEVKFIDSLGKDRVKIIPLDKDLCKKIAETVINLYIYLKSKEK